jgi:hypothetical protein
VSFDFVPNEQQAALLNAARRPSTAPDAGVWDNFLPGAGSYTMRSLAEVGRAVDLAGSAFPIIADTITGGTEQQDRYFREHDDVFNSAVDHWAPRPGEVGTAGQVVGQLVGGLGQAIISPALLVGTSQLSTAEDLVRQGVDAGAANVAGDVAGLAMAAGVRLPFLGQTAAARIASGAAGNVALGAATAGATRGVLTASGHVAQAEQFDPLDVKARTLDALLGAAFGGLAHLDARSQAALLVTNQAHHMETSTAPGRPATEADATAHVQAVRQAVDQLLHGDPVSVDGVVKDGAFVPDAVYSRGHDEVAAELQRLARQEAGAAIIEPPVQTAEAPQQPSRLGARLREFVSGKDAQLATDADPIAARARLAAQRNPDLQVPTGKFAEDGTPVTMRAAELMALADGEARTAKALVPDIFRTAANCLLRAL